MHSRRYLAATAALVMIVGMLTQIGVTASAAPANPTDESKVPHYFGPNPNWALSPLRVPDIAVDLTGGGGTGATAAATVDPQTGAVTGFTITNPGSGYTSAPTVNITSATGAGASATAVVDYSGVVTAVTVNPGGSGYTAPSVAFSGGGAVTDATGIAYGGVDAAALIAGTDYSGYTMPVVEFGLPNDPAGVQATGHATCVEDINCTPAGGGLVTVNGIVVDTPGSGYSAAPSVTILDGPSGSPVSALQNPATATLAIQSVFLTGFGSGYTAAPTVTFSDTGAGSGAAATATVSISGTGAVTAINVDSGGSGYMTPGIKKFTDQLPGLCDPAGVAAPPCPTTGKYIPLAVPKAVNYNGIAADEYEIGLVQYRTSFSSSLPDTLVRGYVQLKACTGGNGDIHLANAMLVGPDVDTGYCGVTPPQWLGPVIAATKNKPVRIVFRNLLPTGAGGDLFLPVDSTIMGSGEGQMGAPALDEGTVMDGVRNPMCTDEAPGGGKPGDCFKDNRATLHLHGGISPWISDGTPHQWITPATEDTPWPQGVSVEPVPDMTGVDTGPRDGVETFYYTNQQSARLMFYHDHAWAITRLNVYAGEAAGYLISDDTEKALVTGGLIPGAADTIPLVVQDRTFVPQDRQLYNVDINGNLPWQPGYDATKIASYGQDPTWDKTRWGGYGNFWYHHVYMPAQNPGDPSGMSAYGRWMYGPWFWPPAVNTMHGPIDNPYYNPDCNLDDPTTWQYQTDPFCEPQQIPGTPNISAGMEQFNDTPIVNGVAYPTVTLEPKTYRFRILSAANDRFFNFQWYVADPTQGDGTTEVALDPALLAAAQTDPVIFPTPVHNALTDGPDWIQIGTEGGFLPAPVVVDGQQETTWITDPTRFDVGNVDKHSLLLAPAERADVIVDFSKFAGETLILYNDAPAAFPARVPSYDYYTGSPDLSPNGAPGVLPGYGPNTRTIMQVKIAGTPASAFNLTALENAFAHKADGSGVFESGQHPIIVGQAAYNSAYGKNFASGSNCNAPGSTLQVCDGFVRVNDTTTFKFNTLLNPRTLPLQMKLEPKAIHDEMNSTTFDEFGRMQANLGVEAQPPAPGAQNVVLYPFVNPQTELIDGTDLPKQAVTYDANGLPVSDVTITPISSAKDGTQIWRITHNGVDTHPIHFHLYDVQLVNRVTWDNIIIPPDATELGWKDTVRIAPLEDTIVALRPIIPQVPFEVPNAIRNLSPMLPTGSTLTFNNVDPQGNPTAAIVNRLVNFGWEYVYHCHILSHEEMDMMRPVTLVLPPNKPDGLVATKVGSRFQVSFNDNSITETSFVLQRTTNGLVWTDVGTSVSPLADPNTHGPRSITDGTSNTGAAYLYRVVAKNTVGYGGAFPSMTAQSISNTIGVNLPAAAPAAPSNLTATLQTGPQVRLQWVDNASNESGFVIERAVVNGGTSGPWTQIAVAPARNGTGSTSYTDTTIVTSTVYVYRVAAVNLFGGAAALSAYATSDFVGASQPVPAAPSNVTATNGANQGNKRSVVLTWTDNANDETGFTIQRATNAAFTTGFSSTTVAAAAGTGTTVTFTQTGLSKATTYYFRVRANNAVGSSVWVNANPFPIVTNP